VEVPSAEYGRGEGLKAGQGPGQEEAGVDDCICRRAGGGMEGVMDKNEFLSELEKSLSVLQEDELRDIISEYEQHIDIKVEKGLTEAEAIADFGSLQELTAEILQAYHVRVDYAAETGKGRTWPGKDTGRKRAGDFEKLKETGGKGILILKGKMKNAGIWIARRLEWGWRQLCRPFVWIYSLAAVHSPWQGGPDGREMEALPVVVQTAAGQGMAAEGYGQTGGNGEVRKKDGKRGYIQKRRGDGKMAGKAVMGNGGGIAGAGVAAIGRGVSRIFWQAIEAALWGIRLIWNGCWIIFSVFTGGFGLLCLFGIGLLAVLAIEGYPLTGVMVGCAGLVLCMFSAAGLGMTLLWKKGKGKAEGIEATGIEAAAESRNWQREGSRRRIHRPGHVPEADRKEMGQEAIGDEIQQEKGDGHDA